MLRDSSAEYVTEESCIQYDLFNRIDILSSTWQVLAQIFNITMPFTGSREVK